MKRFTPTIYLKPTGIWKMVPRKPLYLQKKTGIIPYLYRGCCCSGVESTYKVMVGRSKDITGSYYNKANQRFDHGGGTFVLKGNEDYAAISYNAAYTFNGTDYLIAHGYDLSDDGNSKLLILEIEWDEDDWPMVSLDN